MDTRADTTISTSTATVLLHDRYVPWSRHLGTGRPSMSLQMRGYARLGDRYHFDDDLCRKVFDACAADNPDASLQALKTLIPSLDGGWALVAQWPDGRVLAATDRMRTIPLFWAHKDGQLFIADDGFACAGAIDQRIVSELAALEFVLVGYVSGDQTLFDGVQQLRSGEMLSFDPRAKDATVSLERYYRFYPSQRTNASETDLEEQLTTVLDDIFHTFAASLSGETIVVPLSGGLDSRLVAAMLKRHGVEDVVCFTYGDPQGEEERISQQVAQALGYRWSCVPYDGPRWQRWREGERCTAYARFAGKCCSKPLTHDLPAVMQLTSDLEWNPEQAIFFPGHTGDMISGGHLPPTYRHLEANPQSLAREIWDYHYRIWPIRTRFQQQELRSIHEKIARLSAKPDDLPIHSACAQYEMWDAENRQALYILNSVRAYEFIGARWRTMWDYPLMDFFLTVPIDLRFGERLYVNTIRDHLFTGTLRDLAAIPIAGKGDWTSRYGLKKRSISGRTSRRYFFTLQRAVRQLVKGRPLAVSPRVKATGPRLDPYMRLFGHGFTPDSTRIRDAFQALDIADSFPKLVADFLESYSDYRPHEISYMGLSCAVALGEILRDIQRSGTH